MSDRIEPLVPSDCDLRDFAFLPLEGRRLLTSETWILGTPEERCAALCLLVEAWYQVPAASLPESNRMLAHLSQAGARWPNVKAHALRGWVRAADGRLYHSVLGEKARDAWARKQAQRERTAAARAARHPRPQSQSASSPVTSTVTEPMTASKGQGQGQGQGEGERAGAPSALPIRTARATRFKPEGKCPDAWREVCQKMRSDLEPQTTYEAFSDFWIARPGQDGLKLDWTATWRNWLRKERPGTRRPGKGSEDVPDQWWKTDEGVRAKAIELEITPPVGDGSPSEWLNFKAKVIVAAGEGPWVPDERELTLQRAVKVVREQLHPPPR